MNVDRINAVADAIEQHSIEELGFNMNHYMTDFSLRMSYVSGEFDRSGHECNTVACIAGWANVLKAKASGLSIEYAARRLSFEDAALYLGFYDTLEEAKLKLTNDDDGVEPASRLFFGKDADGNDAIKGENPYIPLDSVRPEHAVRVLRHLAATGEVDWSV